jgi:hypothetical protein
MDFFLGDDFIGSIDSRHFGPIPENAIIVEIKYILFYFHGQKTTHFLSIVFSKKSNNKKSVSVNKR